MDGRSGADAPGVLIVCTANICRSPVAELALRHLLFERGERGVHVWSAGTKGMSCMPMDEVMARLLAEHGVDSVHFRSHQLTRPEVDRAALVLTMTTQHRSQVVQLAHHALNKTFTLLEFSALTKATRSSASNLVGAERVRQAVTTAASLRSEGRIMVEVQDIDDPYRRRHSVYRHVFEQVVSAMEPIADALAPHPE